MATLTSSKRGFKIRKASKRITSEDAADREEVMNLQDLRLAEAEDPSKKQQQKESKTPQIVRKQYDSSEDNILCSRFPHMKFCGCDSNCLFEAYEVFPITKQLYVCNFISGCKTRSMIESGITHVLNITSKQYTKRSKFFKYCNIDIHNNTQEDIKKFFRITNRYIQQSIEQGGTVLIHSCSLELAVCFAVSFLIGVNRLPIKTSMDYIKQSVPKVEVSSHFYKQLQSYDLEKLAFVTIKNED